jgi:aldehyde:ferredoxin oxidoreductase
VYSYRNKVLHVDLTRQRIESETLQEEFCRKYIGGNGFGIYYLCKNAPPRVEPFDPANVLIFATGPFAGTCIPSAGKYIVHAKSPLTFLMGESVCSGSWGPTLKWAGYDAVVITGKAAQPTYLFIDDDSVQFKDAKDLWGRDSWETEDMIKETIGDRDISVAAIGPAGENLVRYACITSDKSRQAGRTGMGAVMGSKKLKALAVRGSKSLEVAKIDELVEYCNRLYKDCQGDATKYYRLYGTPGGMISLSEMGISPTRNWQQSSDHVLHEEFTGETTKERYHPKMIACQGCPIACDPVTVLKNGPYKGTTASVEQESLYGLGLSTGVGNYQLMVKATEFSDRYGVDTISVGVTIGWAMECYQKGLLTREDTGGLELKFGNGEAVLEIIRKIAYRKGIGDLLAEGVKRASEKLGKDSQHFAMHSKGLELPDYEVRGLKVCALAFMTSTRGGHHMTASAYDFDLAGKVEGTKADPAYGRLVADRENLWAVIDSLILCKFTRKVITGYEQIAELYRLATGLFLSVEELSLAGERIYTLEKSYNIREGWTLKDETYPARIFKEPIGNGPLKGIRFTEEERSLLLEAYFKARGWSAEGIPPKEKLAKLGLDMVTYGGN